jgi:ribonuclease J
MADKLSNFLAKSGLLPTSQEQKPASKTAQKKHHKPSFSTPSKGTPGEGKKHFTKRPSKIVPSQHTAKPRSNSVPLGSNGKPFEPRIKPLDVTNHVLNRKKMPAGNVRIIPLGGMEQVGQNMMMLEMGDDIIVIDTGLEFPSPEHLGIDVLIPDVSYLKANKKKIRGIVYTHGHLDHIGGAQHMMQDLGFPPMYGTKLTNELLKANSDHPEVVKKYKLHEITADSKIKLGKFEVEFFHVNHSIPDAVGVAVNTPFGLIIHTGDFKIEHNPSDKSPANLRRVQQLGDRGVALAMVDSTNVERDGNTQAEAEIEADLTSTIRGINGRVIIATFASNIGRIARIVEAAEKDGRTVFISGRSMERNLAIARKLDYLKCKEKTLQRMSKAAESMPPDKVLILSTGSQGEELAALTRMAAGTHRDIHLTPKDTVIFSSSPIPGNEIAIVSVLNNLADRGVKMLDNKKLDSHVSGHGHAEEIKLMTSILRPKFIAPIHGELYMRYMHKDLICRDLKLPRQNAIVMKNGQGVILSREGLKAMDKKSAFPQAPVLIELGEKIGDHILADRKLMANGGTIFVSIAQHDGKIKNLSIRSRGFRYMGQNHEIFQLLEKEIRAVFTRSFDPSRPVKVLEETLGKSAEKLLWQKFKKDSLVEVVVQ